MLLVVGVVKKLQEWLLNKSYKLRRKRLPDQVLSCESLSNPWTLDLGSSLSKICRVVSYRP